MSEPDAAVAIVHAREPQDAVLLIRRAEREGDAWSGHWSFPGGRRDPADPDLLQTALRELEEECGIRLAPERMERALPLEFVGRRVGARLLVAPFVFRIPGELPAILDPQEAVQAVWTPLGTLRDPGRHRLTGVPGLPLEMRFPAIDLGGVPLWGFTYRVIVDWLGLAAGERACFEAASRALDFLLAHGLALEHGWRDRTAAVKGEIPVPLLLAEFSLPGDQVPAVSCLEAGPDCIRVLGPALEEYRICASCRL